ncbi:hypothetical protein [Streptomyces tricolor]|uniref:hypothetical protein n=1 Tax=Streptomyces tricolor TaxID=68277 RepID=UPI003D72B2AC
MPAQPLREAAGLGEVFPDVPLRDVADGRLEPDPRPPFGRLGGGGREAFHAVPGHVDGVGVQLVAQTRMSSRIRAVRKAVPGVSPAPTVYTTPWWRSPRCAARARRQHGRGQSRGTPCRPGTVHV